MASPRQTEDFPIPVSSHVEVGDFVPSPDGSDEPTPLLPKNSVAPLFPPFHYCNLSLPEGCYQLNITKVQPGPLTVFRTRYQLGTLRSAAIPTAIRYSILSLCAAGPASPHLAQRLSRSIHATATNRISK